QRGSRGPRLWTARGRILDGEVRFFAVVTRKGFRKPIVEEPGGFEIAEGHNRGFRFKPVVSQSQRDERVVEWPHGADVVANGVVAAFAGRHRANTPATEQSWTDEMACAGRGFVVIDDSAPEQMPDIRGQ